jgi:predicted negative regulator of RcsB-dependent stress response
VDDLLSEKEQIDKMRAWWSVYGNYVIGGVVLGALILFGINQMNNTRIAAQEEASNLYQQLTDEVVAADVAAAEALDAELSTKFADSAYAAQAKLALARLYMDQNRDQDAADALAGVVAMPGNDAFKLIARARLAKIMLYQDKAEEVLAMLEGETEGAFASRYAEILGDAYVALGRTDDAREAYQRALGESRQAATVDQQFVQLKLLDLPLASFAEDGGSDAEAAPDEEAE